MNELKQTLTLEEFYGYCLDIAEEKGQAFSNFYQASEIKSGKVVVDITYRIIEEPEQLELDFGE